MLEEGVDEDDDDDDVGGGGDVVPPQTKCLIRSSRASRTITRQIQNRRR